MKFLMDNTCITALIDTGAEVSLIKDKMITKNLEDIYEIKPIYLEGIGIGKFKVDKAVKIILFKDLVFGFKVVDNNVNMEYDMIIGMDFLNQFVCKIDCSQEKMTISNKHVIYFAREKDSISKYVNLRPAKPFKSIWRISMETEEDDEEKTGCSDIPESWDSEEEEEEFLDIASENQGKSSSGNEQESSLDDEQRGSLEVVQDSSSEDDYESSSEDDYENSSVGSFEDDEEGVDTRESLSLDDIIQQEDSCEDNSLFDMNYYDRNDLLEDEHVIKARSINIVRARVRNENCTGLVNKLKLPENLLMSDSFDEAVDKKVRIMIVNVGDSDVRLRLPELEVTKYDVMKEESSELSEDDNSAKIFKITKNELEERIMKIYDILPKSHVETKEQINRIKSLIRDYAEVFHLEGDKLPEIKELSTEIAMKHNKPINIKQYRVPMHLKEELERQVKENLAEGIIRESRSAYNAPVILVPKPPDPVTQERRWRLVVDFRRLNEAIEKDSYPIPNIEETLHNLHEAKYFSTLDWYMGFYQMPIREEDKHLTAFSANNRKYEYNRLPMGITIAPSSFQRNVNLIMNGLTEEQTLLFLDDILVKGKNIKDHDKNLRMTLDKLKSHGVKVNTKKCILFAESLIFLGHRITPHGIFPDDRKIQSVINWPTPKTVKQVQKFIGLVMYYKKFIPGYMKIAEPLYELTRKNKTYRWTETQENAFKMLKEKLTTPPVLAIPDPDPKNPFILITDGCDTGYGAVLAQKQNGIEKPIAFFSKAVSERDRRLLKNRAFEHEFRALAAACKEFRYFLRGGKKFIVYTDSRVLAQLNKKSFHENENYAKWYHELIDYDFDIKYRPGNKLQNADSLSRMFRIRTTTEIERALKECHDSPLGGHRNAVETMNKLKSLNVIWPNMAKEVKEYVDKCEACQKTKISRYTKKPMQITDTQSRPFEKIALDIVGPVNPPSAKGHKYILTIRDLFSKYTRAIPMFTQTAEETAKAFVEYMSHYGAPEQILTDQGSNFMSETIKNLCKRFQIKKLRSTAFHPQSNGSLERYHRDLKTYLKIFTTNVAEWDELLGIACLALNTSKSRSTSFTPFEIVFMHPANIPSSFKNTANRPIYNYDDYVSIMTNNIQSAYKAVKENLGKLKEETKKQYDKKTNDVKFKIGDKVLALNDNKKITRQNAFPLKWEGPYEIIKDLNNSTYELKVGRKTIVKHGDQLKLFNY